MTNFFMITVLLGILELMLLHSVSPKKIELTILDAVPTAIVYSNYFFLPFTTKIRKYKNIEKACIRHRIEYGRHSIYKVYDLVLKYSKKSVFLFKGKREEKELLKCRDEINQFIGSLEDCVVYDSKNMNLKIAIVLMLFLLPLFLFILPLINQNPYYPKEMGYLYCLYVYLIITMVPAIFILLSLTVNNYKNSSKDKKVISQTDKANNHLNETKKYTDANSESQRIYDSIIK